MVLVTVCLTPQAMPRNISEWTFPPDYQASATFVKKEKIMRKEMNKKWPTFSSRAYFCGSAKGIFPWVKQCSGVIVPRPNTSPTPTFLALTLHFARSRVGVGYPITVRSKGECYFALIINPQNVVRSDAGLKHGRTCWGHSKPSGSFKGGEKRERGLSPTELSLLKLKHSVFRR